MILIPAEKIALIMPIELDGSPAVWGFQAYPEVRTETITISNILCNRVLPSNTRQGPNDAGELWVAYELGIVLKDSKPDLAGDTVWQVSNLSLTEPDAAVFEIPDGFSVTSGAN